VIQQIGPVLHAERPGIQQDRAACLVPGSDSTHCPEVPWGISSSGAQFSITVILDFRTFHPAQQVIEIGRNDHHMIATRGNRSFEKLEHRCESVRQPKGVRPF